MTGWIYRIYDTRNGISYIGQTTNINGRIKQHKYSIDKGLSTSKVYVYFRDVPKEYIGFEVICKCTKDQLNALEDYYIKVYDTYKNGLNTASVSSAFRNQKVKDNHDKVYKDWLSGKSYTKISEETGLSITYISNIIELLRKPGDIRNEVKSEHTNKAKPIICYDKYFNFLARFSSTKSAIDYLERTRNARLSHYTAYVHLKQSALNGNIAFGFRWQYESDLHFDGKIFNTKWDIEAYKNGGKLVKNKHGLLECDNSIVKKAREVNYDSAREIKSCKQCHRILSNKTSGELCSYCMDHNTYKDRQVPDDLVVRYPFIKEELQELYPKYTVNSIAKHCGVSYTTVNKWLKRFGIK